MPTTGANLDWVSLAPEILLTVTALLCLVVGVVAPQRRDSAPEATAVSLLGTVLALGAVVGLALRPEQPALPVAYALAVDGLALFFKGVCILASLLVLLLSMGYSRPFANRSEFFALLMFAQLAMCLLCSATDIIMVYLSLEFLSLVSYILAGYTKQEPRSNEAAVKYFLFGAVSAGVMLYGLSLLYGMTGSTDLSAIASGGVLWESPLALLAMSLVAAGLLFKVSAAPFHMWTPDVYQGAPLPVAAFLSVASKAAGFAVLARVAVVMVPAGVAEWSSVLALVAAVTMTLGNLAALKQQDIVRLLAYSTIAQAGYILMGIAALSAVGGRDGLAASMMYLLAYLPMNLGAFAVVTAAARLFGSSRLEDYRGLAYRSPWLAWTLVIFLISLAGLPPTAGFVGKYFVFQEALRADLAWLAVVAFLNSVIAAYYYFNVMRLMVFHTPEEPQAAPQPNSLRLAVAAALLGTLILGVVPAGLMVPSQRAAENVLREQPAPLQRPATVRAAGSPAGALPRLPRS